MPQLPRPGLAAAGLALAAALGAAPARAGSFVISVGAADAPGAEAALGRGYSQAGRAFLGNCFVTVAASQPSFDVRYRFEAVAGDEHGGDSDRHQVRIVLAFHVYNRALDESASVLAPAAIGLLGRGDLVGFFDACGTSYARSITRSGTFESTLSYQDAAGGGRDHGFEQELESWIKGWGRNAATAAPPSKDLARRATRNRLAVRSTASGMGKRAGTSLVAGDLESFRAAAQAAYRAMQADDTGVIDQVELVPWSDHPHVRLLLGSPRGERRIELENSELLSELNRILEVRRVQARHVPAPDEPPPAPPPPSRVESCMRALTAGDTLRTRSYHQLPPCRGVLFESEGGP